ncbi:dihydrolipoyl dehydrogenase [Anaeramoeba flamelloides]|uniref:Dihydrolipoyl dehydrogenase n=1 Tax=Anaeramoeba flamelloides TaxID=1746091 RepID=A0AAV7Z6U7_9EUKA|nr:dihydrolipoyl dehydrogenase [Anaeramoeba flamelloides]
MLSFFNQKKNDLFLSVVKSKSNLIVRTFIRTYKDQDVVVIGGGPAGYIAAINAAQEGLTVACVEKRGKLGGTCLNEGCISSKSLLHSTKLYHQAVNEFTKHGIDVPVNKPNLDKMMENKNNNIYTLTKGIDYLFRKNKVTYIKGTATIASANEISIEPLKLVGVQNKLKAKNIIIATGSTNITSPLLPIDEKIILSSKGALSLRKIPKTMLIIGGGTIGLEMATIWNRLGTEVTVVELEDTIGGQLDSELASGLKEQLMKQNIKFLMSSRLTSVKIVNNKYASAEIITCCQSPRKTKIDSECVLVSIGRKPYYERLGIEKMGIHLDHNNKICTNENFQTNIPNIYAIGDITEGPMLAHRAEKQGMEVIKHILNPNKNLILNQSLIPNVIYTDPQVASIGCTEEQLMAAEEEYTVGKFPYFANPSARTFGILDGFVKILSNPKTHELLGAHILGPNASEAIHEIALGMHLNCKDTDLGEMCHAHPTLSEAIKEAAMSLYRKPIHL